MPRAEADLGLRLIEAARPKVELALVELKLDLPGRVARAQALDGEALG